MIESQHQGKEDEVKSDVVESIGPSIRTLYLRLTESSLNPRSVLVVRDWSGTELTLCRPRYLLPQSVLQITRTIINNCVDHVSSSINSNENGLVTSK